MSYREVAQVDQVPPGSMKSFPVGDKQVLIVNYGGKFYALDNRCTHAGGDLSQGKLEGKIVTCPRHGAQFDATTGECVSRPRVLFLRPAITNEHSYEVRVEGGSIQLNAE